MVSFWPWRGDSQNTESFERTLSALSLKISETQTTLERKRATCRRVKVLWTLYLTFAYVVCVVVLLLVLGRSNMGAREWNGLAAGPVMIYLTRRLITAIFDFQIDRLEGRLKEHQSERAKTIKKLKEATKYDSTLQLLEKYGGGEGKPATSNGQAGQPTKNDGDNTGKRQQKQQKQQQQQQHHQRTNMPPPATANIQKKPSGHFVPSQGSSGGEFLGSMEEFAPNAFPQHQEPALTRQSSHMSVGNSSSHWYDRIMDTLLGEDETSPKNRIILICQNCRLVNGQAPPGVKKLSDIGIWRCMACSATNGEMDEGKRIVREVLGQQNEPAISAAQETELVDDDENDEDAAALGEMKETTSGEGADEKGLRKRKAKGKK